MKVTVEKKNDWVKNLSKMTKNPYQYIILNTKDLWYKDQAFLELCLNILDVCRTVANSNKVLYTMGGLKSIDTSIMFEAMNSILNSNSFNQEQLERYFEFIVNFNKLRDAFIEVNKGLDDVWIDTDIDWLLMGYSIVDIEKIYQFSGNDEIHVDEYFAIQEELKKGNTTIDYFISRSKELLNALLKAADEEKKAA